MTYQQKQTKLDESIHVQVGIVVILVAIDLLLLTQPMTSLNTVSTIVTGCMAGLAVIGILIDVAEQTYNKLIRKYTLL